MNAELAAEASGRPDSLNGTAGGSGRSPSRVDSALDLRGLRKTFELLRRLHSDGQTIILGTHDADVGAAAECLVRMRDGRVAPATEPATAEAWPGVTVEIT